MITQLNHLLDSVETDMSSEIDISAVARELATTEYHLRRMFSSLSGMVSVSPNRRPSPTILTRSTFLPERGLSCARLGRDKPHRAAWRDAQLARFSQALRLTHAIPPGVP